MAAPTAWNTKCQKGRRWANISWKKYHCRPMLGVRSATCTTSPLSSSASCVKLSYHFADIRPGPHCCNSKLKLCLMLQDAVYLYVKRVPLVRHMSQLQLAFRPRRSPRLHIIYFATGSQS